MSFSPQGTLLNPVAAGVIAVWSGTIASIPAGWIICDGNGGTPNLLAKFIEGVATAVTNPGATGGTVSKNTAGHTHTLTYGGGAWSPGASNPQPVSPTDSSIDSIADIRPPFYDGAFIYKT